MSYNFLIVPFPNDLRKYCRINFNLQQEQSRCLTFNIYKCTQTPSPSSSIVKWAYIQVLNPYRFEIFDGGYFHFKTIDSWLGNKRSTFQIEIGSCDVWQFILMKFQLSKGIRQAFCDTKEKKQKNPMFMSFLQLNLMNLTCKPIYTTMLK